LALAGCSGVRLSSTTRDSGHSSPANALTLWYRKPATEWVEALPVGNGRLGAMVFGGIPAERLQINEDTFFGGGPYDPVNPDARAALPEVRSLIVAGRYAEAQALANAKVMARPLRQMSYQPLADLHLIFPGSAAEVTHYQRELDLDSAVARTRYSSGGVTYVREVLASTVDQVIALRLTADRPGSLRFDLTLDTPQIGATVLGTEDTLIVRGAGPSQNGIDGALRFEARAYVATRGGSRSTQNGGISIRDADECLILIAAATNYRRYDDLSADPASVIAAQIAAASRKTFQRLLADHVTEHQRLFRRVSIDLGRTPSADLPTDERIRSSAAAPDPALAELYFQYGRYLLISCSRPGSQPANLQGLWNDQTNPSWGSKWTININTEMNYWPAEPTQLGECVQPLIAMVKDIAATGAHTARAMYGARGWVTHHNTDVWRATAPVDDARSGLWPTGGAWLCQHLWDRYDYDRDPATLAEIYPLMKGAAEFFLDTLVDDPASGGLVTSPSLSPENSHPHGARVCAGPAMDRQILRDLFARVIEAATLLAVDVDFRRQLDAARQRLVPDRIGAAGQLQEWLEDWDLQAPEIHHRHVSHLYALYPSSQINVRDTPALAAAARKSLEIRGDEATGWGIGWRLNLWARLGDGDHAHRVLTMLLQPDRTYPNLFDAHPPFQIDGNFGGTSGIAEMLLQSWGDTIHLLPALPSAWPDGSVTGLRVRGGCAVDITWRAGRLVAATFRSDRGGRYRVSHGTKQIEIELRKRNPVRLTLGRGELRVG
jgi:alpha-L-fucosidase 2